MIVTENLRLKYPNGQKKIFDNLSLHIKDKEKVLILGPSGSGKSTLLNVLSGIVPNLIDLPMKYDKLEIDHDCGVIFQEPDSQFCMPKVYEELAFVLENLQTPRHKMDAMIETALDSVDLNVNKDQYINNLSGGMKQKLAIAETLLQQADTLFLDEPTAMLDVPSTEDLWNKIKALWQDQTVIIVEHKVEHIWQHIDRVILLNYDGVIIGDASPADILKNYEHLLSEYGVWHPKAWDNAPSPIDLQPSNVQNADNHLLLFEQGSVKRRKQILIDIPKFNVTSGEWITITGANGSGKTSLLESIMQLIKYDGTMFFDGKKLTKIKEAAKNMYLVYQNPELQFIANSVYKEIFIQNKANYPSISEADDKTVQMLKMLNLEDVQSQHPYELSIGQKRRLSVAIALSSSSDYILLDEPTFGLDSHNTFNLIKLFQQRVKDGQTIIMVTHDPEIIARYPTRKLYVRKKQILEIAGDNHV
ncbi:MULTISPECIES: ABC transporter ATP-binding protein [Staphylococcus]|uniref:ABC transporter ATP-binding protein n=3 Tax=Staphylococcus cohnii TaxID=29382 RepID=A0A2T4LVI6_9STAP|nr:MULTISPECIES: ABC transporter ATP-binding protein [Staphylococcus]MBA1352587.1 ATP-binding cassette domain-containing protein [Staphylococcus cohnii]MBA1391121.1 ATP-binding cassette domain-containing protein [Staphylococcus cohnii]MCE5033070.1 ABC transporter ATP-binding protein [Staphylococcus cohnii]MCE5099388.1 ABC transporter ATP-binding protein [Staphylococcus cohnii]MSU29294.1 ABC transporter ATP-binding protein [Staphylococcus sp. McC-251-APC-3A2]